MGKAITCVRTSLGTLMLYALALVALLATAPNAFASSKDALFYVPINRSELVTTSANMAEVIIADPEVADVYVHGRNKVSVIGKMIGQTTLRIFDSNNRLIRSMDVVVTYDLPAIRRALNEFLPNERIGVELVNTRIALTGSVSSAESAATAVEIAEQFVTGKLDAAGAQTRRVYDRDQDNASPILNLMKITAGQQVMLRIRIGEIQRTALKNLGVNLQAINSGTSGFTIGTGGGRLGGTDPITNNSIFQFGQFAAAADAFSAIGVTQRAGNTNFSGVVEALERDGVLKILAEPNLVALSGEQAEFLAGGEFPIPVPQDGGTTTVEYRPFGVALRFTPVVLSEDRIRIQVQPEVSEISNERTFRPVDGSYTAPSLVTRRASTTVELAPGEGFMIAGLIRDNIATQIDELPGAGDIPVLGALFRSTAFQRNETELVIAVTPYLVDPSRAGDIKLPTDEFRPASFLESALFGALASTGRSDRTPSFEGPSGFLTD